MNRFLFAAKTLAFLGIAVFFGMASVFLFQTKKALVSGESAVSSVAEKLDLTNKEAQYLILQAGLTANEARKASIKESGYLDTWNGQLGKTLGNVNGLLGSLKDTSNTTTSAELSVTKSAVETLKQASTSIQGFQPVLENLNLEAIDMQQATQNLDNVVTDPAIPQALGHVNGMTADVQEVVHKYLHPTWPQKVWHVSLDVVHALNPF